MASLNYYKREGFTRDERGDWAELPIGEACVTQDSYSDSLIGTANGSTAGQLRDFRRPDGLRVLRQR